MLPAPVSGSGLRHVRIVGCWFQVDGGEEGGGMRRKVKGQVSIKRIKKDREGIDTLKVKKM